MDSHSPVAQKALAYAFLLLKFRLRSEKELIDRLKKKQFPSSVIVKTVSFLRDKGFLDDTQFARVWLQVRLRKPYGLRRISQELRNKGVPQQIITKQSAALPHDYSETEVVLALARKRTAQLGKVSIDAQRRRLYAYLARRGFDPDIVATTVNQICKQTF